VSKNVMPHSTAYLLTPGTYAAGFLMLFTPAQLLSRTRIASRPAWFGD
jgi:hypothetical protein